MTLRRSLLPALFAALLPLTPASAIEPVDLELAIATDVSFSIDMEEARLQRQGIVASFQNREVIDAIRVGAGSFVVVAHDFNDFARAIRQNLILEMAGCTPARQPTIMRASAPVLLAQAVTPGGPPYEKGCDIGEKLRWGGWGGTPYPSPDFPDR